MTLQNNATNTYHLYYYLLVVATMKSHVSIECREIPKPTATQVTAVRQLGPAVTTA